MNSTNKMSQTFVDYFSHLLKTHQIKEASEFFAAQDNEIISNFLSEIVPIASQYLTESNWQNDQELYKCCKTILNITAEICNPKETVLELLVQIEYSTDFDDLKFFTILEALRISLMKMTDIGKTINWCLNTIKMYIGTLNSDDQEATDNRNMNIYKEIMLFLEPLIYKAIEVNSKLERGSLLRDSLLSFLIFLYGKPFCMMNKITVKKEMYKELLEKMMALTFCLTGDPLYFLDIVDKRYRNIIRQRDVNSSEDYTCNPTVLFESVCNMAYATFYFHIITEEKYWKNIPQVYNLYYIFEKCIYLVCTFLQLEKEILIWNGLIFMENIINRIPQHSVSSEVLELKIYLDIFKPITNIMIYCTNSNGRKKALNIFRQYIALFNMKARYAILLYLYDFVEHSGLLSLIINMFKSSINECFDSTPRNYQFLGKNIILILNKICNLPHGSSSDIAEISDEIITTLNLLRFLFIKDKHKETGIWNMVDAIENNYLKPLECGIHMSKGHWKVKIKDLEQLGQKHTQELNYEQMKKEDAEVTLTVGGEQLPVMPLLEKISFCYQVLNGLDVMESILVRVNECISTGRMSY